MDGFGINLYKNKLIVTFFAVHHDVNYGALDVKNDDVSSKNCKSTKPSSRVVADADTMRETWWNGVACVLLSKR